MLKVEDVQKGDRWYLKVKDYSMLMNIPLPFTIQLVGKHHRSKFTIQINTLSLRFLMAKGTLLEERKEVVT